MNIETFVTCDFAQDNMGKLTVVGMFDTINAKQLPLTHPFMCIALRMRFMMHELGKHSIRIEFRDPNDTLMLMPFEGQIDVSNIGTDSGTANIVLNHMAMQFKIHGKYLIRLFIDTVERASIPLYINRAR